MRTREIVVLALLLAAACGAPVTAGGPASSPAGAPGAARAPDFSLPDLDGRNVSLSDYQGRDVVLIDFWATWCTPCGAELPQLERLYQTYKDQGFVILGVSMDGPETVAEVAPQARRYGLSFPVLLDQETRVTSVYNPRSAAPYAVLIGRDGAIAWTHEGYVAGDEAHLEEQVKKLLEPRR